MRSPELHELHDILFVYDTLRHGQERQNFLSEGKSRFLGMATTTGELYTIGDFPGLVIETSQPGKEPPGANQVSGDLFEIFDPSTFFATLDVIAGYWPEQTERSLFVRRLIPVQTEDGSTNAWAYILNLPANDLPRYNPTPVTLPVKNA